MAMAKGFSLCWSASNSQECFCYIIVIQVRRSRLTEVTKVTTVVAAEEERCQTTCVTTVHTQ